ncbi:hypothetical protein Busp01_53860 [Trinickia caryophylli]|uniref:Uncharacterized protein n=2 Tax=Trinickia caryophylli TaxID=28094 RepID=A0A1X7H0X8_TRICW|nr:hypothetical protein Busp01_53860 [Trinickia caryophylli]SMF77898.1 hypothetical protein SAMN06295900_12031 [Trinickia caryophylli]
MQENPVDAVYWPFGNWSYNAPVLKAQRPAGISFSKAQETELMHVQFAYAAISKATDGEASIGLVARRPVSGVGVPEQATAGRLSPARALLDQESEVLIRAAGQRSTSPFVAILSVGGGVRAGGRRGVAPRVRREHGFGHGACAVFGIVKM